jgi:hypothetical protein
VQLPFLYFSEGPDRHMAATAQVRVGGSFGPNPRMGGHMIQRCQQNCCFSVICAALDPNGTLTHCGKHDAGADTLADAPCHLQAQQTGGSENNGVKITIVQALQASIDVASKILNGKFRKTVAQQRLPAQAAGAHYSTSWKLTQIAKMRRDQRITRIFTLTDDRNMKAFGLGDRHILHRMNRKIDPAI